MECNQLCKISSWNVRGLGGLVKLKQVITRLKHLGSKIVFLQETHLTQDEAIRLRRRWQGQVFAANFSSQSRGVVILIHKSIPFQINSTTLDPGGRFIILQGNLFGQYLNLVNVYGPNKDDPQFYNNIFLTLSSLRGEIFMGGDFNCALNPKIDRNSNQNPSHNQSRKVILNFMDELGLCDAWRELNPEKREFSCYSATHKTFSRLDFFLISRTLLSHVENCYYSCIIISDHATVSIEYKNLERIPRTAELEI